MSRAILPYTEDLAFRIVRLFSKLAYLFIYIKPTTRDELGYLGRKILKCQRKGSEIYIDRLAMQPLSFDLTSVFYILLFSSDVILSQL